MLFLLKQQRYWKSISLAIRFVLLTEAFLQINIKLFGLILIITAYCILLFWACPPLWWALPHGSGFSLQSFLIRLPANQKRISTAIPNAFGAVTIERVYFFIPYNMYTISKFLHKAKGIGLFQIFQDILKCNSHNFSRVKINLIFLQKKGKKSCFRRIKGITFATANKERYWLKFIKVV
ncbi:MAG: hypothetical protein ACYC0A_13630 [Lutibacter sp.]